MDGEILNAVLKTLIDVLLPVILGAFVVMIKEAIPLIRSHIEKKKLDIAIDLARQLVQAAEQNGLAGKIKDEAKEKHDWVIARLEAGLKKRGIDIDLDEHMALIEAQVWDAFNQYRDDFWLDFSDPEPEDDEAE